MLRGRPTVAVVSSRPVPGRSSAGCLPAAALFCGLCACSPLPRHTHCPSQQFAPVQFALLPLFSPCAPGSSGVEPSCLQASCLQAARLSRWQQQRGSAVAARAPSCVHHTITGVARLPEGSRIMETACGQPMRRCPLRRKKGEAKDCIWAGGQVPHTSIS